MSFCPDYYRDPNLGQGARFQINSVCRQVDLERQTAFETTSFLSEGI